MTWLIIKLFAGQVWGFVEKYWRVILIALILGALFFYKSRYESTVQELADYKAEIKQAAKLQELKNIMLQKTAAKHVNDIAVVYQTELESINAEYKKRTNATNITIATLRKQLRDKIRSDSFTVPEIAKDTSLTAEEWRERYAALAGQYETLKEGARLTTSDFNLCRQLLDADAMVCEREE
jgi:hypothetical protein